MRIYVFNKSHKEDDEVIKVKESNKEYSYCDSKEKPKDWAFMEQSGEVLRNIPDTWKQYPDTEAGAMSIIDMEMNELKKTTTVEDMKHELVHVGSACLHLWRKLMGM